MFDFEVLQTFRGMLDRLDRILSVLYNQEVYLHIRAVAPIADIFNRIHIFLAANISLQDLLTFNLIRDSHRGPKLVIEHISLDADQKTIQIFLTHKKHGLYDIFVLK